MLDWLLASLFSVFFRDDVAHWCGGIGNFGGAGNGHLAAAQGSGFPREGNMGCAAAGVVSDIGSRVVRGDAELGRSGDRVLVGAKEQEGPPVRFDLMFDLRGDIGPGEARGGVLKAVGEDGDDDLAGPVLLGQGGEAGAEFIDRLADGVEERGAVARDVGFVVQRKDFGRRDGADGDEVFIVEKDEGELGEAFDVLLVGEETIEAVDGGLATRLHGAGAIKNEDDFGIVVVHARTITWRVGHPLG